jgi:hypothetical protein
LILSKIIKTYSFDIHPYFIYNKYMPREPRIMQMDWKSLGYEREYKDGRLRWVPEQDKQDTKDKDPSS